MTVMNVSVILTTKLQRIMIWGSFGFILENNKCNFICIYKMSFNTTVIAHLFVTVLTASAACLKYDVHLPNVKVHQLDTNKWIGMWFTWQDES